MAPAWLQILLWRVLMGLFKRFAKIDVKIEK
jgi:hypothetical protein